MAKATQKVYSVEAAMAKLYAAEVAMEVTTKRLFSYMVVTDTSENTM